MVSLHASRRKEYGLSLVELLIALTIGLLLLAGLTLVFVNSSEANRELQKTAQQIENGRYATDIVSQDLRLAGFYGHYHELPAAPAGLPDPCEIASAANLQDALALPVQGYRSADLATRADVSATTCDDKGLLTAANLGPGSDVLVIRRAETNILARPGGIAESGAFYIQASGTQAEVQVGGGIAIGTNNKADGATASTIFRSPSTLPVPPQPAPMRKLHVHVYFVAPCSVGGASVVIAGVTVTGICQNGDDSIPTLKRLELFTTGGATVMRIVPLVEGIEYFKIEYGIDTLPDVVSVATFLKGDSTVDSFTATPGDWTQVIAAKLYVLARNTEWTANFTDDKTYALGTAAVPAANDRFRRHVYTAAVRLMNASGRREIP